jgi:hypothetical protein
MQAKMMRDPALQDLSRDHHAVLVQARTLRRAAETTHPPEAWSDSARTFAKYWDRDLEPHLREEESVLLPLVGALGNRGLDRHMRRVIDEHARIRADAHQLRLMLDRRLDAHPYLGSLGRMLTDHVRFEEEVFFQSLQAAINREQLDRLWQASRAFRHKWRGPDACVPL